MDEDWALYAKFQNGDVAAFHALFDRYKNRIFHLSYRFVKSRETAEDIAQDVLIKVYEKKVKYDPHAKFSTWVYRVAVNASLDHLRTRKFFGFSLDQPKTGSGADSPPLVETVRGKDRPPREAAEQKELTALVGKAVQDLPESLRVVILLFQFEEKSYQEIADILSVSVKAVERRIYHAKKLLQEKLSEYLS